MTPSLFRRLLGAELDALPPLLRAAHDRPDDQRWSGTADVRGSRHPLARLLCRAIGLPAPGSHVPVTVDFERRPGGERWRRSFAGRRYASVLTARHGLLVERMGPVTNVFRVSVDGGALRLDLVGFRFLGVPLPAALRPRCHAREHQEDGRYVFDVPIDLWPFGRLLRYTGRLERCDD